MSSRTTLQEQQQRYAENFLEELLRDKDKTIEEARAEALAKLPLLFDLSREESNKLFDEYADDLTNDKEATPLERARAKLAASDFEGVLEEAATHRSETRELEMLAGTAALAKFRETPVPKWNEAALAAFQGALALSDPDTEPEEFVASAISAATALMEMARYEEAEPLLRRALAIDEKSYGTETPSVAIGLNNLAGMLLETSHLEEAEPMVRRALAIDEKSYGPEHPSVARDLNNLAQLLKATNRLKEAEPLMRRALAIDEKSYGPEHPSVSRGLNNLAALLQATNRLEEAEPLFRRALAIVHKFGQYTGHEHPHMQTALQNYANLLVDMEIDESEIEKRLREFTDESDQN